MGTLFAECFKERSVKSGTWIYCDLKNRRIELTVAKGSFVGSVSHFRQVKDPLEVSFSRSAGVQATSLVLRFA